MNEQLSLSGVGEDEVAEGIEVGAGRWEERAAGASPRLKRVNRRQLFLRSVDLEGTLPEDHEARGVWRMVEGLDLSQFHQAIQAREGEPGQSAIDPAILVTLWLYATSRGVGSGRELDRLCKEHDAYRWICGGVSVNYHTLNDFRVGHQAGLDDLFTQVLAVMTKAGVVTLSRVAQDGTRVRANAGADTFRRERTLRQHLEEAKAQVEHVKELANDPTVSAREAAARQRAAKDREERIQKALEELPKAREAKKTQADKDDARTSETDPEARVMKMGDGGFRPAYNLQFSTTTEEKVIVGVSVTNLGNDFEELSPMLEQIEARQGALPSEALVDGGYVKASQIETADEKGVTTYAPVKAKKGQPPDFSPKPTDSTAVAAWRERMGTDEAKAIYKERCETAELVNAVVKERYGLTQFPVRGLNKVLSVGLWMALTYNVLRYFSLSST
jgi:transposase